MSYKILVIDDEESLCDILKFNLQKQGYMVNCAYSAEEALERDDLESFDLFIVDIMMEQISGYDFVQRLRTMKGMDQTPAIFCSALNDEDDKVTGLNIGGDDYITKPFIISEVLARVRAVLRRSMKHANQHRHEEMHAEAPAASESHAKQDTDLLPDVIFHDIRIDQNAKTLFLFDKEIPLTRTEYDLLLFFVSHRNRIYSRDEIMRNVWPDGLMVSQRAIDTNLSRLRRKLGDYGKHIISRQGFGYGFKEED